MTTFLHKDELTTIPEYVEELVPIDRSVELGTPYTYPQLMKAIGWKELSGQKTRESQLEKLKCAVELGRDGRKYVVNKVYEKAKPLPLHKSRVNINILTVQFLDLLIQEAGELEDGEEVYTVYIPRYDLAQLLGVVNDKFYLYKAGLASKKDWDYDSNIFKDIPIWPTIEILAMAGDRVKDIRKAILENMRKQYTTFIAEVYMVGRKIEDYREATAAEEAHILSTYSRVLAEYEKKLKKPLTEHTLRIYDKDLYEDFRTDIKKILKDEYNIESHSASYKFVFDKHLPVARERIAKQVNTEISMDSTASLVAYCKKRVNTKATKIKKESEKAQTKPETKSKGRFDLDLSEISTKLSKDKLYLDEKMPEYIEKVVTIITE